MADVITAEYRLAKETGLKSFVQTVLEKVGVTTEDAAIVADVLVAADLRGVESHGVARLESYYVSRLRNGQMEPRPNVQTIRETATSLLVDAGNGLGHPTAKRTMERLLDKAGETGAAFGAVRGSNHFGIAGYYAMLALDRDMIGIASTNSTRFGAPTFGRDILLGTNPLAFAIPADKEPAFVLDFATTTVPKGSLRAQGEAAQPRLGDRRARPRDARSAGRAQRRAAAAGRLRRRQRRPQGLRPGPVGRHPVRRPVGRRVRRRAPATDRRSAARQDLALLRRLQDRRVPRSGRVQA
jgi:hypothetical protein